MNHKSLLLATAAGSLAAPQALAADMGARFAPATMPTASWTGWYVGGHLGAAWQQSSFVVSSGYSPISATLTDTGFMGGGQLGYNFQQGNFVYGLEADISGLSGNPSLATPVPDPRCSSCGFFVNSKINWLSTVRGRAGLAVNDTLVYLTAGVAIGGVTNHFGYALVTPGHVSLVTNDVTRTGLAVGGGVEHMIWGNWSVRLEGLFADLGRTTTKGIKLSTGGTLTKTSAFSNLAVIGRGGLNLKF
jgi:outer membrane immunogenic protein